LSGLPSAAQGVRGILRVVLSVFDPLTGVLLTESLKPQCSHSIQMRAER
jgi:hypothetical protein